MTTGSPNGTRLALSHVRAFLAVAKAGSFTAAALEANVTQAALSNSVAAAERALGVKLLQRGSFGARLTENGRHLYDGAWRLIQAEQALLQEAQLMHGELVGRVHVAAFPSLAQHVVPAVMQRLPERYPRVHVHPVDVATSSQDVLDMIEAGDADIGLVVATLSDAHFHWKLFEDHFVVCVPDAWAGPDLTWTDLRSLPLIAYDKDWRDSCMAGMQEFLGRFGLDPGHRVRDTSVILALIASGLGFSILPALAVGSLPAGVTRVALPLAAARTVSVAVPREALSLPAVRAVLSILRERFPESDLPPFQVRTRTPSETGVRRNPHPAAPETSRPGRPRSLEETPVE